MGNAVKNSSALFVKMLRQQKAADEVDSQIASNPALALVEVGEEEFVLKI